MQTSQSIMGLAGALASAQGEIEAASKDRVNPAFKSKYADLTSIWEACRPALKKNGLCIIQEVMASIDAVAVTTRILHKSGEWLDCGPVHIPFAKKDAQGVGSAITYAKRYGLAAALGVVADDDDDGNAASNRNGNGHAPAKAVAAPVAEPKSPPGISAVKVENREKIRDLNGCDDADSLIAMINTDEFKRFAWKVCKDFPQEWIGEEDNSGLSGAIAQRGEHLKCTPDTDSWIHRMERARDDANKQAAE